MDRLPLRQCFSPLGKEGHCHLTDRIRVVVVFFFFLNFLSLLCGMQDLSSLTSDGTSAPAVEAWSVNCWTTGEVPAFFTSAPETSCPTEECSSNWVAGTLPGPTAPGWG